MVPFVFVSGAALLSVHFVEISGTVAMDKSRRNKTEKDSTNPKRIVGSKAPPRMKEIRHTQGVENGSDHSCEHLFLSPTLFAFFLLIEIGISPVDECDRNLLAK